MNIVKNLFSEAYKTSLNAYAPYSNFKVGSAIYADNNKIYTGCNVENISFPCGTCAESNAIAAMIADGGKQIREILIIADSKELISPCGACSQRIAEFGTAETLIHLADFNGIKKTVSISDIIPLCFKNKDSKK